MPAEVKAGQDWSQSGGERPSRRNQRVVATDLTEGFTRSVQTSKNNSLLQCRFREVLFLGDRARSYPERRWTLSIRWSALRFWSGAN